MGIGTFLNPSPMYGGRAEKYWYWSWGVRPQDVEEASQMKAVVREPSVWDFVEKRKWREKLAIALLGGAKTLLDLGSGAGKLVDQAVEMGFEPNDIVGLDLDQKLVGWCNKFWPEVSFLQGDCSNLSDVFTGDQRFDLITSHMLFNHLDDDQFSRTLESVSNLLSPSGRFMFMIPNPIHQAQSHKLYSDRAVTITEKGPWGGDIEYHHRSHLVYHDLLTQYYSYIMYSGCGVLTFDENTIHLRSVLRSLGESPDFDKRLMVDASNKELRI